MTLKGVPRGFFEHLDRNIKTLGGMFCTSDSPVSAVCFMKGIKTTGLLQIMFKFHPRLPSERINDVLEDLQTMSPFTVVSCLLEASLTVA